MGERLNSAIREIGIDYPERFGEVRQWQISRFDPTSFPQDSDVRYRLLLAADPHDNDLSRYGETKIGGVRITLASIGIADSRPFYSSVNENDMDAFQRLRERVVCELARHDLI